MASSRVEPSEENILAEITDRILDEIAAALTSFVVENDLDDHLVVSRKTHGVSLLIQDVALFESGRAEIHPVKEWIVEHLGLVTMDIELPFHVSGHTDSVPISSARFRSNWELSAVRAAGVARTLVAMGQDPLLVRVRAFGEFKPVASNETPEGRALNRRVELFFSRQDVLESEWLEREMASARPTPTSPQETSGPGS